MTRPSQRLRAFSLVLMMWLGTSSCSRSGEGEPTRPLEAPHIIVLIADDLGIDVAPCHSADVLMPKLDKRCGNALVFDRAYAHPVCSASRASLLTGRHPFQTGTGDVREEAPKLALEEITLPEFIRANSKTQYRFSGFGKWHLADGGNGGDRNPNFQGFDHFEGTPRQHHTYQYFDYDWTVNGELQGKVATYRTTYIVDAVLADFEQTSRLGPQLSFVNFTNPHRPYQAPPAHLHSQKDLVVPDLKPTQAEDPPPGYYRNHRREAAFDQTYHAMLEALDTEIDRLVTGMDVLTDRPVIYIFLGDNGSAGEVYKGDSTAGYRAKATVYEGGIRVPLQIWSSQTHDAAIVPGRNASLVHLMDLFSTIAELAGVPADVAAQFSGSRDSISLVPILTSPQKTSSRAVVYVERGNKDRMPFAYGLVDREGYKLIARDPDRLTNYAGKDLLELYDTRSDPGERSNLLQNVCGSSLKRSMVLLEQMKKIHQHRTGPDHSTFDARVYEQALSEEAASCTAPEPGP